MKPLNRLVSAAALAATSLTAPLTLANPLLGKWHVTYEGMGGEAVYDIRSVDDELKGYMVSYKDGSGVDFNEEVAVLTNIKTDKTDKNSATANYLLEYEGQQYQVDATLQLLSDKAAQLKYSAYGYQGKEQWSKLD